MSEAGAAEQPELTKKQKSQREKQEEHIVRIQRTLIASLLGIFVGVLSFYSGGTPDAAGLQNNGLLGFMLMLAAIVIQKHIFMLIGIDTARLGGKDWFYQGFMTFAFWFMTWAILLSSAVPFADFSANVTSGTAPVAISFMEITTGSPTSWHWDFGDGSNSTNKNPDHIYTKSGKFNVTLSVSNVWGSTVRVRSEYISVV